jgi:hypothetical protein
VPAALGVKAATIADMHATVVVEVEQSGSPPEFKSLLELIVPGMTALQFVIDPQPP